MMKINTIRVINSYGDLKELFALNTDEEILNFIEKNKNIEAEINFEIEGIEYYSTEVSVKLIDNKLEIIIWVNQPN